MCGGEFDPRSREWLVGIHGYIIEITDKDSTCNNNLFHFFLLYQIMCVYMYIYIYARIYYIYGH
jgi:hypothetical protein